MHIFYNIHIRPRKFPFLVCTVGDLFSVQLKRLLENRMVDMLLGIEHHFLIYIALPENQIEKFRTVRLTGSNNRSEFFF